MGFNLRGDKNSLALLSSKRVKAYSRTRADEAFALPSFSDAMPAPTAQLPHTSNTVAKPEHHVERQHHADRDSENVKQTMLQHESVFKEQLHELHRLYQKQCILMVESQKGNSCHPHSEPPSSNSSLLCNSDTFKPLEDGRLGDESATRACDTDRDLCTFPSQMTDVKPFLGDSQHQEQAWGRPMLDLERPAEGRPMFDLERPPDDVLIFDLERPAEEYLDVEVGKEKAGLGCTLADASVLSRIASVKERGDTTTEENRDFISGNNRDPWGRSMSDFRSSYDRRKGDYACKDEFGSKERMCEGYFHIPEHREVPWAPLHPSNITSHISHQDSFPYPPVEAVSGSVPFRGLPDLNGELSLAENQTSLMRRKPVKHVNDCHYIDLESDSSAPNGASKLPHWLVQPPPTSSKVAAPTKFPPQTTEWPQKTTWFSPQAQDTSTVLGAYYSTSGAIMKASTFQEPYNPWLHSKANSQEGEVSFKQPSSSLHFFSASNTGTTPGLYNGAHVNGVSNESIHSFLPYITDMDKMVSSTASRMLSSHCVGRQDIVFDTQAASKELLSSISSRETTALPPALPWYQQKESFSSLMRQASNPEPPFQRESHACSINQWGAAAIHQVLPTSGMNNVESGTYGMMHSVGSNFESLCLVTKPESPRKEPAFDFLLCSAEQNAATSWKQMERPFYIGQNTEETTLSSNDRSQILTRNVFDLNVSSEVAPMEENFDSCHFTQSRCHFNQNQAFKEECETFRNSGWDISRGNKDPCLNEQQKGLDLQATGFADRVAEKGMGSEVLIKDATQSPINSTLSRKPGMLCFQRERLGHDICTDNCYGDDETGAAFVEVKSSDASGLTSCESRDAAHLELTKARDDSNTSSGEACQSRESRIPCHKEEVALSLNVQSKRSGGLPLAKENESQQWGSFLFSRMQSAPGSDTKGDCSVLVCTDESEAANSVARKHLLETADIAELLLSLSFDLPPVAEEGRAIDHQEKSLDWLANIIPQEENCEEQVLDVDMAGKAMHEGRSASMHVEDKVMDPFELAVLALKPINSDVECLNAQVMERGSLVDNGPSLPTLRRRSSRRGRAVKDFQREILGCMTSLSRHEITEDLQIIEGLIKSTTEEMNMCSFFQEDKPSSSPESGSQKKARGTKAFRGGQPNGNLNVCSWGESTRRKRMGRQRSQRSCLPPGVQSSPLENNLGDGLFFNVAI